MSSTFDDLTKGLIVNGEDVTPDVNPFDRSIPIEEIKPKTNPVEPVKQQQKKPITQNPPVQQNRTNQSPVSLFEVGKFQTELRNKSIKKNKAYHLYSENITAYDIASGCSRSVFYRIKNIPARNYADKWLPVD